VQAIATMCAEGECAQALLWNACVQHRTNLNSAEALEANRHGRRNTDVRPQ
jgi:hypothetical protein